ncbi:hypothetical protein Bca52824_039648 [Brassica carinata]|uniref:Uncharacterized protein n=1 Tax=Brassica carinata TaxID=52824 RepID=A0A8X7UW61_BRACI|nr:hypothetical protein Bca52824_039648 [Brassica carinata]
MEDQEKEKDMENPGMGLRMVLVKPRSREGSAGKSNSGKVRKSKEAAGRSSQADAGGTNLFGLPNDPVVTNTGGVLPTDQANLTGTQQGNEEGQQHQEHDEEVESSNANRDGDKQETAADGTAKEATTPSKKHLLEAMKVMGDQVDVMTQLFTPLVNSSVDQSTPVVTDTPIANGPAVDAVEVIEIDPPVRTSRRDRSVPDGSSLQHVGVVPKVEFPADSIDPEEIDAYWMARGEVKPPLPVLWVPPPFKTNPVAGCPSRSCPNGLAAIRRFCRIPESV